MQRFFSIIIIFGILLVGGSWVWIRKSEESAKAKRAEDLAAARRTFADKARAAAGEEDEEAYERQIRAAIASYNEELKKRVYGKAPEAFDPGRLKAEVDEKFEKGEMQEAQHKSWTEGYGIVRAAYDTLMSGNWRTSMTAQSKDFRLDLYDMKRAKDDQGNPVLDGKFFFWGIEDATRVAWGPLTLRFWTVKKQKVKEGRQMVEKDVEQVLGKADGESTPHIIMQQPHKYIAEFPSYVSVGHYWLPLMPREAISVDVELGFVAKTPGGDRDVVLKWEKLKIPDAWKLGEGESWQADVVEATEDEIAGKEGQEQPAPEGE